MNMDMLWIYEEAQPKTSMSKPKTKTEKWEKNSIEIKKLTRQRC